MVFEHIDKLKQEYTGKYVLVDETRPELRRFVGLTGTVQTVNMNGLALVEFDGDKNIGRHDIDVDYLKVIDKPLPKPEEKEKAPRQATDKSAEKAPASKPAAEAPKTTTGAAETAPAAKSGPAEPSPPKTSAPATADQGPDAAAPPASVAKSPAADGPEAPPKDPPAAAE